MVRTPILPLMPEIFSLIRRKMLFPLLFGVDTLLVWCSGHRRLGQSSFGSVLTDIRERHVKYRTRRHSGRYFQPAVFYTRAGSNLQAARHRWPGHWRPSLGDVTASKLEYADDVGLLDWTAAEASERVSALARGSRTSASMEMSAPKSKGMHVHIRERLPVSTEVEVEAVGLPHSCPECKRTFPTRRGLAVHRARWCHRDSALPPEGASSLTKPSN